jgi:hypothetical protein
VVVDFVARGRHLVALVVDRRAQSSTRSVVDAPGRRLALSSTSTRLVVDAPG